MLTFFPDTPNIDNNLSKKPIYQRGASTTWTEAKCHAECLSMFVSEARVIMQSLQCISPFSVGDTRNSLFVCSGSRAEIEG